MARKGKTVARASADKGTRPSTTRKLVAPKDVSAGLLTDESILLSLTPAMRKKLREAMRVDGAVTVRLEPRGSIALGRILRAYPVMDPPN
jgi:hypothetical protein